jgi:hypothetical protein
LSHRIKHFLTATGYTYPRSLGNKPLCDRSAYACTSSCDEYDLSIQFHLFASSL